METPQKITQDTDNGVFEILFRDRNWAAPEGHLTDMMRSFVDQHNKLIDHIEDLKKTPAKIMAATPSKDHQTEIMRWLRKIGAQNFQVESKEQ
jgi:hypothetical protein